MQELGIFGGTFNPIHWGHLLIAESARKQFKLDKVLFVTGHVMPHRSNVELSAADRFEMVAAAVSGNPFFEASRLELDRQGPSYTVDTLRLCRKEYGDAVRLNLIVGGDNAGSISTWHEHEAIFELARILVARRPSQAPPLDPDVSAVGKIEYIDFPQVAISSSLIRKRRHEGKSIRYMVPEPVYELIERRRHYL